MVFLYVKWSLPMEKYLRSFVYYSCSNICEIACVKMTRQQSVPSVAAGLTILAEEPLARQAFL